MRTLLLVLALVGCTSKNGGQLGPDMAQTAADMARASDGGGDGDMALASGDLAGQPPGPDLAGGDMAKRCGDPGQQCCVNGGPPNPNVCHPAPGGSGYGIDCRHTDNICVYCGGANQQCCSAYSGAGVACFVGTCQSVGGSMICA